MSTSRLPHHALPSPIRTKAARIRASLTVKVPNTLSQSQLKQLLGSAYFGTHACLILTIEGTQTPLAIHPASSTLLGRSEIGLEEMDINFFPYLPHAQTVSRVHAILHRESPLLYIEDLNSTNGTYVNGQRLIPNVSHILRDRDQLKLGSLQLQIAFQYG